MPENYTIRTKDLTGSAFFPPFPQSFVGTTQAAGRLYLYHPSWPLLKFISDQLITDLQGRELDFFLMQVLSTLKSHTATEATPPVEVDNDVWAQMPPKRVFSFRAELEYKGPAQPRFFPDWPPD
jgi:hypothetical protein